MGKLAVLGAIVALSNLASVGPTFADDDGGGATDGKGSPGTVDPKPPGTDGLEVFAPGHEGHLVPGPGEQPPEHASHPSGSDDGDAHDLLT